MSSLPFLERCPRPGNGLLPTGHRGHIRRLSHRVGVHGARKDACPPRVCTGSLAAQDTNLCGPTVLGTPHHLRCRTTTLSAKAPHRQRSRISRFPQSPGRMLRDRSTTPTTEARLPGGPSSSSSSCSIAQRNTTVLSSANQNENSHPIVNPGVLFRLPPPGGARRLRKSMQRGMAGPSGNVTAAGAGGIRLGCRAAGGAPSGPGRPGPPRRPRRPRPRRRPGSR